jgi:hypothetical protein
MARFSFVLNAILHTSPKQVIQDMRHFRFIAFAIQDHSIGRVNRAAESHEWITTGSTLLARCAPCPSVSPLSLPGPFFPSFW